MPRDLCWRWAENHPWQEKENVPEPDGAAHFREPVCRFLMSTVKWTGGLKREVVAKWTAEVS